MKTGKKLWSLVLAIVMVVSLLGGAFVVNAADGDGFVKATSLDAGREYLIVTEYEGKYYALTCTGGVMGAVEVTVADDAVAAADDTAIWLPDGEDHLESKANPGKFIFAGSGGFMVYDSSMLRTFTYDAAAETVALHGVKFGLVFTNGKFDQGDPADACKVLLFARGEAAPVEEKPEGPTLADFVPPETVYRDAVRNADGSITLAFTSDIHNEEGYPNIETWLEAAEADVGYIDAFGSCGDMGSAYASNAAAYWAKAQLVFDYFDSELAAGDIGDVIYTTGNHEWFPTAGGDFGHEYFSGNYPETKRFRIVGEGIVTDAYIIYCLGAGESAMTLSDYRYLQSEVDEFAAWLETAPTDIPIFVLIHYPLHKWGGRGEERMQANAAEIIDIMNEHPNLVVLWGHNHSNYDDNYYLPLFPGDEMVIDADNNTKKINFTYMAAGATADIEYTGPEAGSAATINKGLIVTINADGSLDYKYYTIDGQVIPFESPWMVRFRGGFGNYEVFNTQFIEDGKSPEPVEAPEVDGYVFAGWYTWKGIDGQATETLFDFDAPITQNTLVTAKYRFDTGLDANYVYLTIQMGDHIVVGKSGTPILMYPVPYVDGMTAIQAFQTLQDMEYDGTTNVGTGGYGYVTDVWGCNPENGAWLMQPGSKNCYVTASSPLEAANSYYILTYADAADYASASYLQPYATTAKVGDTVSFNGGY